MEIARAGGAPCLRLRGRVAGSTLTLEAEPAPELLGGARFTRVGAGEEPIPAWWQGTSDFGAPVRRWVPMLRALLRAMLLGLVAGVLVTSWLLLR